MGRVEPRLLDLPGGAAAGTPCSARLPSGAARRGASRARGVTARRPGPGTDNHGSLSSIPEFLEGEAYSLCTSSSSGQKDVTKSRDLYFLYKLKYIL